jgi:hypothetical protein
MAANTVGEVLDALLLVFLVDLALIVLVTVIVGLPRTNLAHL